ncbi:MAG TPA: hypothetical protein VFZ24_08485 [Longimicrobiales bacterium]
MMQDDGMDELMGRALREVDVAPSAPREEMWARIQAERSKRQSRGVIARVPRVGRTWIPWSAAIAATLVLGIGLGRISTRTTGTPADVRQVAGDPEAAVPTAYRLAATQHMQRTETLLATLAVDGGAEAGEMSRWARDLLTDTRLLLGSPAAEDPATRRLLQDLELVLLQIAGIPAARAEEEVELIQDGINQSDVLLRLRAATAGPALVGT